MKHLRHLALIGILFVIAGSILYLEGGKKDAAPAIETNGVDAISPILSNRRASKDTQYPPAQEISTPDGFINTPAITVNELIGKKVILVDFWTYSCINCQRTTPYLNAWYEAYADKGLEILAIHTPEFEFEEKYDNVKRAVEKFNIKYPVILDNDYSTWSAYKNRYWPRKYLIDIDGYIVYDHIGEGAYEETEREIQKLLKERAQVLGITEEMDSKLAASGIKKEKTRISHQSPEIYFGADRNEYLGNGTRGQTGSQEFSLTSLQDPKSNTLYLGGTWDVEDQYVTNLSSQARIVFRYTAGQVYFVASASSPVKVQLYRDGQPLDSNAGSDVDATTSTVSIQEDRLYHLIHEKEGAGEHILEMIVEEPGLNAFTFTFGS